MKTYESEKKELFDWLCAETAEYFKALKKEETEKGLSRDSELDIKQHNVEMEYNKKLIELKRKYNIK